MGKARGEEEDCTILQNNYTYQLMLTVYAHLIRVQPILHLVKVALFLHHLQRDVSRSHYKVARSFLVGQTRGHTNVMLFPENLTPHVILMLITLNLHNAFSTEILHLHPPLRYTSIDPRGFHRTILELVAFIMYENMHQYLPILKM